MQTRGKRDRTSFFRVLVLGASLEGRGGEAFLKTRPFWLRGAMGALYGGVTPAEDRVATMAAVAAVPRV